MYLYNLIFNDTLFRISLACLQNHCGQSLGQSFRQGYESLRSFLSTMLVWTKVSCISHMENGRNSNLKNLILNLQYLKDMLEKSTSSYQTNSLNNANNISELSPNRSNKKNSKKIKTFNQHPHLESLIDSIQFLLNYFKVVNEYLEKKIEDDEEEDINNSSELLLGKLITVHCGHNGWLSNDAIEAMKSILNSVEQPITV